MKIAVVGTGYVGLVVGACLAESGNDVICVDKDEAKVKALRTRCSDELRAHGYNVIPSQTNFFMVHLGGRQVQPVIEDFRTREILVGRPFPPMTDHLRVSIGTADEMDRFMKAFKEIFPKRDRQTNAAGA